MTVNQNHVRTMERVTTLSMITDVTVWQASMEPTVIIVRIGSRVLVGQQSQTLFSQYKYSITCTTYCCPHMNIRLYTFSKYIFNISLDIIDCHGQPCQNNGTCHDLVNDYRCDCVAGFNGTNCDNSK